MGYDMYWHRPPGVDSPEHAEYHRLQREAHAFATSLPTPRPEEAQAEVSRLYDLAFQAEFWYFRLNIWGMSAVRDQLVPLGIIRVDYDSEPEFPRPEDFGLDGYPDPDEPAGFTSQTEAFNAAVQETLSWVPPGDGHGVAIHKLGSNDGWHVTPGEIITGLAWAEAHTPDWRMDIDDYALRFCEWMERAAHEGEGFDVH